jgi:hypothetical protein
VHLIIGKWQGLGKLSRRHRAQLLRKEWRHFYPKRRSPGCSVVSATSLRPRPGMVRYPESCGTVRKYVLGTWAILGGRRARQCLLHTNPKLVVVGSPAGVTPRTSLGLQCILYEVHRRTTPPSIHTRAIRKHVLFAPRRDRHRSPRAVLVSRLANGRRMRLLPEATCEAERGA